MKLILCVSALLSLSACVNLPDVYLIDRHTVMEEEASGEWPELESRFRQQAVKSGPTNLAKEPMERRRERAFRVLNGEFPVTKPVIKPVAKTETP
ncbi:MAG: hypothetical protein PVF82_09040 [Gammaproteobacteria bacterium]|jgi:hypothetical protein